MTAPNSDIPRSDSSRADSGSENRRAGGDRRVPGTAKRSGPLMALATATLVDTLRQPLYTAIVCATLLLLATSPALASFTFGNDQELLTDITLNTLLFSGVVLSAFTASQAIALDLRTRTALAVLAKPVGRFSYVAGKFLGIAAAVSVATWNSFMFALLIIRIGVQVSVRQPLHEPAITFAAASALGAVVAGALRHYQRGTSFGQTLTITLSVLLPISVIGAHLLGPTWESDPTGLDTDVLAAGLLLLSAFWVATSVTIALSTRLAPIPALFLSVALLSFGLTSSYFFADLAESSLWLRIPYALVPNLQYLWVGDQLLTGDALPGSYVFDALIYAGLYTLAALSAGIGSFASRNVG